MAVAAGRYAAIHRGSPVQSVGQFTHRQPGVDQRATFSSSDPPMLLCETAAKRSTGKGLAGQARETRMVFRRARRKAGPIGRGPTAGCFAVFRLTTILVAIRVGAAPVAPAHAGSAGGPAAFMADWLLATLLGLAVVAGLLLALVVLWRRERRSRLTAQRLAELFAERERMAHDLPVGLHEVIDDGSGVLQFRYISDRALALFGVSRKPVMADFYRVFDHLHPQDRERVIAANEQARAEKKPVLIEGRFVVDGRQRWLRIESWPQERAHATIWPGCTLDVTDQHEAESGFRVLFEQSPLAIMVHDVETGEVLDGNRASWETYGLDSLEALQQRDLWADPPYSRSEALALIRRAAAGQVQRFEWCSINAQGQPFWELVTLMPVVLKGRLRVFSTATEITELRDAEQRLRDSERLLTRMSELAAVGGWSLDVRSGELRWTEQTFRLHHLPLDTNLSVTDALSFYHPEDRPILERALKRAREHGEPWELTLRITTAQGKKRVVRTMCRPIEQDGRVVRLVGAIQEVTDLVEAERRFRAIFEQSPVAILVQDAATGEVVDANRNAWRIYGFDSFQAFRDAAADGRLGMGSGRQSGLKKMRDMVARGGDRIEWPSRHADGHVLWFDVTLTPIELAGRSCVLAVCLDITQRREAEQRLRDSEDRFRRILQDVDGVSVQGYGPDGRVHYWNRASEELYGYTEAEARESNLLDLIIPPEMREEVRAGLQQMAEGEDLPNGEMELMRKDGSRVPVYSSHTVLRRPGAAPELFCIDIDLSERKAHEEALDRMAHYDPLTGLPNRRLMSALIEELMARMDRQQSGFALCYLDLDDFKPINDRHGHDVGDQVLVAIAERLRRLVRGSDLVSRLGGDEFVLVLEGIGDGPELERKLSFILDGVVQPIAVAGLQVRVQASIGVTLYPRDSGDPDTLLRHADQAMYRAKALGRHQYSLFDTEIEAHVQRRRERLVEIETGLDERQFQLYYQPKMDLVTGEAVGFEALVRWHHPVYGMLSPLAFLHALERTELEQRFGEYIIDQALGQMAAWHDSGQELPVSVNISGPHLLTEGFVDMLARLLERHRRVAAGQLALEIVESAAVADLDRAVRVLGEVRKLGIQTSLDDFGTGYSSLRHLRSLPVDEVKIDQSFVRDMLTDLNDYTIVQSVISLADAFGLRVVAEGIETEEHAASLLRLGCKLGQGYVFARPMPADAVLDWLAAQLSSTSS
ncbi:MAG: EAL domain-containing protein [Wenzhouxiangella sp.]|nr:MAG: EAL domain-containing protein [Wenzhouxiangella sp.]